MKANKLFIALLLLYISDANSQNVAKCESPGEEIICENEQTAICKVKSGKIYGQCISAESLEELFTILLERDVNNIEVTTSPFDEYLRAGHIDLGDTVTNFSLPVPEQELLPNDLFVPPLLQRAPRGQLVYPNSETECLTINGKTFCSIQ